jgi:hypothetical protein
VRRRVAARAGARHTPALRRPARPRCRRLLIL